MDSLQAARLARLVEDRGMELGLVDPAQRRIDRLERVQSAWLRELSPRSVLAARGELERLRDADSA